MKVTERKLQANRQNAKQSPGPQTPEGKRCASQNRRTYGFFARILQFDTEEEETEYRALATNLKAGLRAVGTAEELLVDRMATLMWHDRKALGLLQRQLCNYEKPQLEPQLARFIEKSSLPEVAIPGLQKLDDGAPANDYSPWECREMVVRVTNEHREWEGTRETGNNGTDIDSDRKANGFHVEARLGHAIETLLRYHTTFERSFERTLNQLLKLQIVRRDSAPVVVAGGGRATA